MAKGISLHLGLNTVEPSHYDGWSGPLVACEADASDMLDLAKRAGFATHTLMTSSATRQALIDRLRQFASDLVEGDILFLTYSGHGGALPDRNDDEPDGQDETWCLFDGQIVDDELFALYSRFAKGVRVVVLSDSCHSGSVTKENALATLSSTGAMGILTGGAAKREMPAELVGRVYRRNRPFYDAILAAAADSADARDACKAAVLLISGCQDNQTSSDGTFNGLFTGTLLKVWKDGVFRGDYRDLHRAIIQRMPPTQSPQYFRTGDRSTALDRQLPFSV